MLNLTKLVLNFISLILGLEEPESFPPPLDKETEKEMFEKMKNSEGNSNREKPASHFAYYQEVLRILFFAGRIAKCRKPGTNKSG